VWVAFWTAVITVASCLAHGAEVKLAWNSNPSSDNVISYRICRKGVPDLLLAETATNAASVSAVEGEEVYVTAVNAVGEGEPSDSVVIPPSIMPRPPMDRTGWAIHRVSSEETVGEQTPATNAIDDSQATFWHSKWDVQPPHYMAIKLPRPAVISAFYYLPRQDGQVNGHITDYEIESSTDGETWEPWLTGQWANDATQKVVVLPLRTITHVRCWGAARFAAAADINLGGTYEPEPPASLVKLTLQESSGLSDWSDVSDVPPMLRPMDTPKKSFRLKIETP
jgi:hypothetical protein